MAVSRRPSRYKNRRRAPARIGKQTPRDGFVLTVVDGPTIGKEHFFEKSATLGRVEDNDVVLVEPGISRNHSRVFDDKGIFLIEDLGSANGTRLNGEKLGEAEVLKDGDYITLAGVTLQFSQLTAARGNVTARTTLSEAEAHAIDATGTKEDSVGRRPFLRTRRGQLIILVLVLLLGAGYYIKRTSSGPGAVADQSDVPLTYSADDGFFNAVYGHGKYDKTHVNHMIMRFEHLGGRATLQYGAWGVDKVGEVVIRLNGKQVGKVPLTMGRWVYGLKLVLPQDQLKNGETNELVFNNTFNPPGEDYWEVCYVQILQEAIPPPDPKEARAQFELAKKAWEDRDIEPGNMYKALEGFKRARDLLEKVPSRPTLYQDALDYIEKVDKTLTLRFSEGLFTARRAMKLDGDPSMARNTLLRTRRYFQKDDFRYREIQNQLDALVGP